MEKTLEFIQVSQAVGLCETLTSLHCYFTDFYYASDLYCSELGCLDQPNSAQRCVWYRKQPFVLQIKSSDWFLYEMQHWAEVG